VGFESSARAFAAAAKAKGTVPEGRGGCPVFRVLASSILSQDSFYCMTSQGKAYMIEERRILEKDCEELNEAVRKAFMLTLRAAHQEQKKKEAAAWQTAWLNWNVTLEDEPQGSRQPIAHHQG
jgi:hypothetical protein